MKSRNGKHATRSRDEAADRGVLIGEEIRQARIGRGMTQLDLARAIGKSVPTVSKIEAGKQAMDVEMLIAVGRALNLSPAAVLLRVQRQQASGDEAESKMLDVLESLLRAVEQG
jgi:transcriptional regulator with XRE-family HTH domain